MKCLSGNSPFLPGLEAAFSPERSWDSAPYAPSKSNHSAAKSLWRGNATVSSRLSPSLKTCAASTESLGADGRTSSAEDSPVKTYPPREKERASTASAADCGASLRELSAMFDRDSRSWKTVRCLFDEVLPESSVILPRSGMMRNGRCWERLTSARATDETGFGFSRAARMRFLTPLASEGRRSTMRLETLAKCWAKRPGGSISEQVAFETLFPTPRTKGLCGGTGSFQMLAKLKENGKITEEERRAMASGNGGALNPEWIEWLMAFPHGWTDSSPLETRRFLSWRRRLSRDLQRVSGKPFEC